MDQQEIKQLIVRWKEAKLEKEKLELQLEDLKGEVDQIKDKLYKVMDAEELLTISVDEGTVYLGSTPYPKVLKTKEDVIEWFDKNGHPEMAPRKLDLSRIKDYLEFAIENDKPLPPEDLIEVKPVKVVKLKQSRKKKS